MSRNGMYWTVSILYLFVLYAIAGFSFDGTIKASVVISITIPFLVILTLLIYTKKRSS